MNNSDIEIKEELYFLISCTVLELPVPNDHEAMSYCDDLERENMTRELWEKVYRILGKTGGDVVRLRCEDFEFIRIAALTGLSEGQAYRTYMNGIDKLRDELPPLSVVKSLYAAS